MEVPQSAVPASRATAAHLMGPGFLADPYALYERLRREDPIHRSTVIPDSWLLTRYRDAVAVLKDARFGRFYMSRFFQAHYGPGPVVEHFSRWLVFRDPPDQSRLHAVINKALSPRGLVETLRPRIVAHVDGLLDRIAARGELDVIADYAAPLPLLVMCELLAIPETEIGRFTAWSHVLASAVDPVVAPGMVDVGNAAVGAMAEYFADLIAKRRAAPGNDLLSALIAAEADGAALSKDELVSNCLFLFAAGHETTTNVIGNGLNALFAHPGELERLRADPSLVITAVEECLRYDPPVQMTGRAASEDVTLGDVTIKAGERVFVILAAANHDPDVFAAPERFDVGRSGARHLSFSSGIHFCLGAQLARAEAQVALGRLLARFPRLSLADGPRRWRDMLILRGLESLPARC